MTHLKYRWKLALAAAWAWLIVGPSVTWGQIGVSALSVDVTLAPGGSFTGAFEVLNKSPKPREFRVEVKDYERNMEGGLVTRDAGTHPRSLAKFLWVTPLSFTLQPEQKQPISFTIKIPEGESGPHWAAIIVTSPVPASESQGQGTDPQQIPITLGASEQFIIKIRHTDPTNAISHGRITSTQVLLPEEDKPLRVIIDYENIGTTFQQPKGEVRFINSRGEVVARVEIPPFPILPGGQRRLEIRLDQKLPSGDYVAVAILDFGGDFLLGAQTRFKIP